LDIFQGLLKNLYILAEVLYGGFKKSKKEKSHTLGSWGFDEVREFCLMEKSIFTK